jgi:hypothetical protein
LELTAGHDLPGTSLGFTKAIAILYASGIKVQSQAEEELSISEKRMCSFKKKSVAKIAWQAGSGANSFKFRDVYLI